MKGASWVSSANSLAFCCRGSTVWVLTCLSVNQITCKQDAGGKAGCFSWVAIIKHTIYSHLNVELQNQLIFILQVCSHILSHLNQAVLALPSPLWSCSSSASAPSSGHTTEYSFLLLWPSPGLCCTNLFICCFCDQVKDLSLEREMADATLIFYLAVVSYHLKQYWLHAVFPSWCPG